MENNKLKGGKADKIRNLDALYTYWADKGYASGGISKSLKKELEHEIALGKKIESEHTSDTEKINEIVFDHLVEDKNYYTKPKPKNWAEKEIADEVNETTKQLLKRLLRENTETDYVTNAAVISSRIRFFILRQGFTRIEQRRTDDRFINVYENGVGTVITTQVYFAGEIMVFFKINSKTTGQMNYNDKERMNNGFTKLFNDIMNDINLSQDKPVEFHIDKL